jgi:hypothetical protein
MGIGELASGYRKSVYFQCAVMIEKLGYNFRETFFDKIDNKGGKWRHDTQHNDNQHYNTLKVTLSMTST